MWFSPSKDQPQPTKELMKLVIEEQITYKNVEPVEQTAPDGRKIKAYPADYLKFLVRIGFKIVPTFADALHFNTKDLFTGEEYYKFPECENKPIRLIYLNPDIWTNERIEKEAWRFEGVRTLPGKTYLRDVDGNIISGPYMLCIGDIDSEGAYRKCQKELQNDWINVTYVTKSRKEFGYHFYWLEDWSDDNDFITIDDNDLKSQDALFEIGIGLKYTQLAGRHRKDANFRYRNVGCLKLKTPEIMVRNSLYNMLLDTIFKDLLLDIDDIKRRRKMQHKNKNLFHKQFNVDNGNGNGGQNLTFNKLVDWQVETISLWARQFYGVNDHYYFFMRSFLGTLVWYRVDEESVVKIIDRIYDLKPNSEPKSKWYDLLSSSYQNLLNGGNVEGRPRLIKAIQRNLNFNDTDAATKQVDHLVSFIKYTSDYASTRQQYQTGQGHGEPDHFISVSEATSLHGGIHKVEGVISAIWPKQKLIEKICYLCLNCNTRNEGYVSRLSNDKPSIFQVIKLPKKCTNCDKGPLIEDKTHTAYVNTIQVELRNPDTYSEIDPLKVIVFDEDAKEFVYHVGEKVIVTGLVNIELVYGKWKRFPYLYAKSIKYESKEKLDLKDSDTEEIKILVREKGNDIINYLAEELFAPKVIGYNDIKKGLLLSAASTNSDTERKKLNTALLGDPGTAKSLLLQEAIKLVPNSTFVSAQSSSAISLTAIVETEKDSHVLRLGPIPLSRGGMCALNEGGGMTFGHQKYLLDVMQEQKFKFSKHGITAAVSSPTGILWSSNPISGKWKNPDVIDLDEFPAIKPLIDRFDLIYVIRDNKVAEEERKYADIKFEMDDININVTSNNESHLIYLQKHIEYSKRFQPKFSDEARFMLKEYYLGVRAKYGSRRVRETIVTIARMIAQLKLKDIVDAEDAKETQEVFNGILEPLQKMVNATTNPIDVIVEECLNILKESNIEWKFYTDLMDRVCENTQARKYIGDAHNKRNYHKLQPILEKLLNHSNVKLTNRNPITISWTSENETLSTEQVNGWDDYKVQDHDYIDKENGPIVLRNNNPSSTPISTFRHSEVLKCRSALNYFSQNNFKNGQNTNSEFQNVEMRTNTGIITQLLSLFLAQVPEFKNFAAFDCEWYREDITANREAGRGGKIYCFCLVDNKGHEIKLHLRNFGNDESKFMLTVLDAIEHYDALIGYGILAEKKNEFDKSHIDGDIRQIGKNCDKLGPVIKVKFDAIKKRVKLLDLHNIFSCPNVKAFLEVAENVKYRNNTLHDVASACLKKGKMDNLKGSDAEFLEPERQLEYCLHDARLGLELAEKEDYRLLKIMHNISNEIDRDFYSTCNYARPTAWWENKLRPLNYQKIKGETARWQEDHITRDNKGKKKGVPYTGGKVLDPIPGIHKDVVTYDVGSMYPTMGNVYNISSETINCDCCKGDPDAKIPASVMELLNNDLVTSGHEPRPWHYWICRKRRGIFSSIMEDLYQKKCEYKKQGLILEEKAVKLFANSGYGTFGQVYFEYYDVRVAELITGFGRHTLLGLRELLKENGVEILYGDTDSLFVKNTGARENENLNITILAREKFHVDFSKERIWKLLVLGRNKKQYFGILENGKPMCKTLIGLRGDRPPYFTEVVSRLVDKETLELFLNGDANTGNGGKAKQHVLNHIRSAFGILDDKLLVRDMDFIKEKLFYTMQTKDPLYECTDNRWQKYIFDEILQDCNGDRLLAERSSYAKSTHAYWKILSDGSGDKKRCTLHPERFTLDAHGCRNELWTCIQPIMEAYGFSDNECIRLKNELIE